ncbi:hypothetical protein BH18CHL2_BH18CHL2_12710 [soil metagenome]
MHTLVNSAGSIVPRGSRLPLAVARRAVPSRDGSACVLTGIAAAGTLGRVRRVEAVAGQESVWDYPRPPRVEAVPERVRVVLGGVTIAETTRAQRVLETSHPPVYYIPRDDVLMDDLTPEPGTTFCEWKGSASYFSVEAAGKRAERAAWTYEEPSPGFDAIRGHLAFYCGPMDACQVGDERARPEPGGF